MSVAAASLAKEQSRIADKCKKNTTNVNDTESLFIMNEKDSAKYLHNKIIDPLG